MQCHHCDREAAFVAESDDLRVGLCRPHFRERVEELAQSESLEALSDRIDVERTN